MQLGDLSQLPKSLKVLLENLLRFEDQLTVKTEHIHALAEWLNNQTSEQEIQYRPARVLMQDFTGVPAVVDLAAMRAAVAKAGGDPEKINPLSPVDLVIDHSVMVDYFASPQAFEQNVAIEMQRNGERYQFLRWVQAALNQFRVVSRGTGICIRSIWNIWHKWSGATRLMGRALQVGWQLVLGLQVMVGVEV